MTKKTLRLRVFAGPHGSGKSTIINAVRNYKVKGIPVDFGIYINADDIAVQLRKNKFSFNRYRVKVTIPEFKKIVLSSGLIGKKFTETDFKKSYSLEKNRLKLINQKADERLAQIVADFLRKKLLAENRKFSFETVFSHASKLDIMKAASNAG